MISYVKLAPEKNVNDIIDRFLTLDIPSDSIIWDYSVIQKQPNTVYDNLKTMLLHRNETLVIDTLTSLGKNNREIFKELSWLQEHKIPLIVLDIETTYLQDTLSIVDQTISEIFKQLAQKEIRFNKACQKTGIENARAQGKQLGRSKISYPENWVNLYQKWKNKELSSKDFMKLSGLKKGTFYNLVKQYETEISVSEEEHLA